MELVIDDLSGSAVAEFLQGHIDEMLSISPPESKHALDLDGLRKPDITFWSMMDGDVVVGCGALKELDPQHGEVKSMRTSPSYKKSGIASKVLQHLIAEAERRGYSRLSLETGSFDFFEPARKLYAKHGFEECEPFADYREDPNSVFMTKVL